jgi:hypothetical protein
MRITGEWEQQQKYDPQSRMVRDKDWRLNDQKLLCAAQGKPSQRTAKVHNIV